MTDQTIKGQAAVVTDGRGTEAEDIAFLASPANHRVTGKRVVAAGDTVML